MMDQNELSALSILFQIGFLSDKIVKTIVSSTLRLIQIDEEVLKEALEFLEIVKSVKENFPPKIIEENTSMNLVIYRLTLSAFSDFDEKTFMFEISTMIEKLERIIAKKKINEKDLDNIINFFSKISKNTLEESYKFFKEFKPSKENVKVRKTIEFEIEKILSQNRVLSRLQSEEFPTDAQEKAIKLLLKTSSMLYRKLISLLEELGNADKLPFENREQLSQLIVTNAERYNHLVSLICKITEFIEASNIRNFPLGIFYTIENVIKTFQKGTYLIVSISSENNFSYLDILITLKAILKTALDKEEIKKFEETSPQCILLFNLPLLGKENIFLQCLIANQIGNYMVEQYRLFLKIMKKANFSNFYQFSQSPDFTNYKKQELERVIIVEQTLKIIKNWIVTIASDLLAIHTFGPAYLFAFSKYLFYTNVHKLSVPLRNRLKIMLEEIKQLNYTKNVEIKDEIEKLEKCAEEETSYAKREIFDLIPKVKGEIKKLSKGKSFTQHMFEEEVPFLISSISNLTPPNEILDFKNKTSHPARIISILNAGWLLKLTKINKIYQLLNAKTREEKSQVDIKLNGLIQKSIELCEIHRKMKEVAK